jgi:hypothetical protein
MSGNYAGLPKHEMVGSTAGTKLVIVVMSALLLRLRVTRRRAGPLKFEGSTTQ